MGLDFSSDEETPMSVTCPIPSEYICCGFESYVFDFWVNSFQQSVYIVLSMRRSIPFNLTALRQKGDGLLYLSITIYFATLLFHCNLMIPDLRNLGK